VYCAVIVWFPLLENARVSVATPPLTFAGLPIAAPPSKNWTVPSVTVTPPVPATFAVNVVF
jgi:hypothetical protein